MRALCEAMPINPLFRELLLLFSERSMLNSLYERCLGEWIESLITFDLSIFLNVAHFLCVLVACKRIRKDFAWNTNKSAIKEMTWKMKKIPGTYASTTAQTRTTTKIQHKQVQHGTSYTLNFATAKIVVEKFDKWNF